MSLAKVKDYFREVGLEDRVLEFEQSSATVDEAAKAVGCTAGEIAKTLSFLVGDKPVLVVVAGDARVDNRKYKETFGCKAKMIPFDQVEEYTGHMPGGVCPFVNAPEIVVYLDVSMKTYEVVYPAAGSGQSAVKLTLDELMKHSNAEKWVDVCKEGTAN